MLQIGSELEKLILYVSPIAAPTAPLAHPSTITLQDVETMVLAAKQRSLYELTDSISRRDRPRAILLLRGLLNSSDGGEDSAIGQLYMLARTFRQMLILHEKNVRDSRQVWTHLWPGFRMPPYAVDDLLAQTRRYKQRSQLAARPPTHRPRRPRNPLQPRRQIPRPRAPRPRPRHRSQTVGNRRLRALMNPVKHCPFDRSTRGVRSGETRFKPHRQLPLTPASSDLATGHLPLSREPPTNVYVLGL